MNDELEFKKLRWRCRRGMKELDRLLTGWLESSWRQSPTPQRDAFRRLLDTEDDRLWRWVLGHEVPDDADVAALLAHIRRDFELDARV